MSVHINDAKEKITPAQAKKWLATMPKNRNLKEQKVQRYLESMQAGQWALNGETIVLDTEGLLMDGQNRLEAIRRSGKTIASAVITGVERASFPSMGQGAARTLGDVFVIAEVTNAHRVATAVTWHWRYSHREEYKGQLPNFRALTPALLEHYADHPGLAYWAGVTSPGKHLGINSGAMAAVLYEIAENNDRETADDFFRQVLNGGDEGSQAAIMHNRLVRAVSAKYRVGRPSADVLMAMYIKCFNAWVEHRPIRTAHWRGGEVFPTVYVDEGEE